MNTLVESWGINFDEFKRVLSDANATVVGAAALYVYFKQQPEPLDPGFEPSNIDIIIPDSVWSTDELHLKSITGLLESSGFHTVVEDITDWRIVLQDVLTGLHNVRITFTYCKDAVQQIHTYGILTTAMSWWCPATRMYTGWAMTFKGPLARRKEMYLMNNKVVSDVSEELLQEYTAYGFKLVDPPCPIIMKRDFRADITSDKFKDIEACDIFTLEDIPIQDFLRASEYNIVLKAGERYYAFERRALMTYMKTKETDVNSYVGKVYETPLNQCIPLVAFEQLAYADYSIYELRPAYSVEVGTRLKSLFHLHCYSIEKWIELSYDVKISPPSDLSRLPPIHQNILMLLSNTRMARFPDAAPMLLNVAAETGFDNIQEFMPPPPVRYSEQ